MDKQRAKDQMQRAATESVERVSSRLRGQWTNRENARCLHHSYEELARSVGLGTDPKTIAELKRWVQKQRLIEPSRPKPKNKNK
jgi:hypothetical protein